MQESRGKEQLADMASADLESIRRDMRNIFENALDDGSLDGVMLKAFARDQGRVEAEDGFDQVRERMREILEGALDSGDLEQLLDQNMQANAAVKIQKVHKGNAVRREMSTKSADSQHETGCIDDIREKMHTLLEGAPHVIVCIRPRSYFRTPP
jgi:hypothetical protein